MTYACTLEPWFCSWHYAWELAYDYAPDRAAAVALRIWNEMGFLVLPIRGSAL